MRHVRRGSANKIGRWSFVSPHSDAQMADNRSSLHDASGRDDNLYSPMHACAQRKIVILDRSAGHPSRERIYIVCLLVLFIPLNSVAETRAQAALSSTLRGTSAVGIVVDVTGGSLLAAVKGAEAKSSLSAPGSILKPLFLAAALEQREVLPQTTVFCRRNLHITDETREWNLACTHPQSNVAFAAREALAYSCNRYFAELADRIPPAQVVAILEHYGLAPLYPPQSRAQKELLVLGVAGIVVSAAQMASAYGKLARELDQAPGTLEAVRQGLKDSVSYGMAHYAAVPGIEIAGKTGTASDAGKVGVMDGLPVPATSAIKRS